MGSRIVTHNTAPMQGDPTTRTATGGIVTSDTRTVFDAQVEALSRLGNHFDALVAAGRVVGAKTYQLDDASRAAMHEAYNTAVADYPVTWITMDNSTISLNQAQLQGGCQNLLKYYQAMVVQRRTHKNAVALLADIPSCDSYDVTTGWPP